MRVIRTEQPVVHLLKNRTSQWHYQYKFLSCKKYARLSPHLSVGGRKRRWRLQLISFISIYSIEFAESFMQDCFLCVRDPRRKIPPSGLSSSPPFAPWSECVLMTDRLTNRPPPVHKLRIVHQMVQMWRGVLDKVSLSVKFRLCILKYTRDAAKHACFVEIFLNGHSLRLEIIIKWEMIWMEEENMRFSTDLIN